MTTKTVSVILSVLSLLLFSKNSYGKVDGTTGIPCGGVGAGAIKFCAHNGSFAMAMHTPTNKSYMPLDGAAFSFFSKRADNVLTDDKLSSVITNSRSDDDAFFPIQTANLGQINSIALTCTLFSPIDLENYENMCYPYAFYEITMRNTQNSSTEAAVAFSIPTESNASMISGGKGFASKGGNERAILASSNDPNALITVGNDNGFFTSGLLNNVVSGKINKVAVKVSMGPNESKKAIFVVAWYQGSEPENFYYMNKATSAEAFAKLGLESFERFKRTAMAIYSQMRQSNIPEWIKDVTANSMSAIVINSVYMKDGRYAHFEGMFDIMGTMDQMWHARHLHSIAFPGLVWPELDYWARTMWTKYPGQIHHDFGYLDKMCSWTDTDHEDYWFGGGRTHKWVDLNCGFIISLWETFISTADTTKLNYFWPYAKKVGQRILDMAKEYGNPTYPMTFEGTECSYDTDPMRKEDGAQWVQLYNSGLAAVSYKIMSKLAEIKGETSLKNTYDTAYAQCNRSTVKRWLTNNLPQPTDKQYKDASEPAFWFECVATGQWIANFLKLGNLYPQENINYLLSCLNKFYAPLTRKLPNSSGIWPLYAVGHYGGFLLQNGMVDEYVAFVKQIVDQHYKDRNLVFNQSIWYYFEKNWKDTIPLATEIGSPNSYITVPIYWRIYYDLIGFHRNKYSGEVWIEPVILKEMNHELRNALFISPEGLGRISCVESGTNFTDRVIDINCDNPMPVKTIYLKDPATPSVKVLIADKEVNFERIGSAGCERRLKVAWDGIIGPQGIRIIQYSGNQPPLVNNNNAILKTKTNMQRLMTLLEKRKTGIGVRINNFGKFELQICSLRGQLISSHKETAGITSDNYIWVSLPKGVYLIKLIQNGATESLKINLMQ